MLPFGKRGSGGGSFLEKKAFFGKNPSGATRQKTRQRGKVFSLKPPQKSPKLDFEIDKGREK